jgi:hypothetical protein
MSTPTRTCGTRQWIFACRLSPGGDIEQEIVDPAFQDKILSYLYQHFVHYTERNVRHAVRLDKPVHEDGRADGYDLLDDLSSDGLSDPLQLLIARESVPPAGAREPDPLETQAGAYCHLLGRHGGTIRALAGYLQISVSHCHRCYAKVRRQAESQRSMALLPAEYGTEPPLKPWRKFRAHRGTRQLDFAFPELAL